MPPAHPGHPALDSKPQLSPDRGRLSDVYPSPAHSNQSSTSSINPSLLTSPSRDCAYLESPSDSEDFESPTSIPSDLPRMQRKRRSWGQPLPEPTTCLPPRKRAKTEAEKEQRRVERIKRNRLAAQTSRERKRLELENLQKQYQDLEMKCLSMESALKQYQMKFGSLSEPSPTPLFAPSAVHTTASTPERSLSMSESKPAVLPAFQSSLAHTISALPLSTRPSHHSAVMMLIRDLQRQASRKCGSRPSSRGMMPARVPSQRLRRRMTSLRSTSSRPMIHRHTVRS